jgi:hypothetical protein
MAGPIRTSAEGQGLSQIGDPGRPAVTKTELTAPSDEGTMAICRFFPSKNVTLAQFNEIHRRWEEARGEPGPQSIPPLLLR